MRITPDIDLASIPPNVFKMAAVLERYFRNNPHAWPSNATLGQMYGCTARQAQAILAEMERRGFITRQFADPAHPEWGRTSIVARRRLDSERAIVPIEENPPPPTKPIAVEGEKPAPSKQRDIRNQDEENNDPSSSALPPMGDPDPSSQAVLARARETFGVQDAHRVRVEVAAHGAEAVLAAMRLPNVRQWSGVSAVLANWAREGYPERELQAVRVEAKRARDAAENAARKAQDDPRRLAQQEADRIAEEAQRAAWEALPGDEKEAIRSRIRKAHPWAARYAETVEKLCCAEMLTAVDLPT